MKVRELIEMLQKANPEDEVKAWDAESEQMESVSGMIYAGQDGIVELCTDDPND